MQSSLFALSHALTHFFACAIGRPGFPARCHRWAAARRASPARARACECAPILQVPSCAADTIAPMRARDRTRGSERREAVRRAPARANDDGDLTAAAIFSLSHERRVCESLSESASAALLRRAARASRSHTWLRALGAALARRDGDRRPASRQRRILLADADTHR